MTGPVASDLTSEQHAAVTHPGGPAIVLAGAGAGKTRVLCRRLAWLVEGGAAPSEVLALTFTREAAVELRARAEELIGSSHETLRVTTFHSYAQELTRVHGVERGLLPPVSVARTEDRMLMLLERLDEPGEPVAEDPRLARAGAREHQGGAAGVGDGGALLGGEIVQHRTEQGSRAVGWNDP